VLSAVWNMEHARAAACDHDSDVQSGVDPQHRTPESHWRPQPRSSVGVSHTHTAPPTYGPLQILVTVTDVPLFSVSTVPELATQTGPLSVDLAVGPKACSSK